MKKLFFIIFGMSILCISNLQADIIEINAMREAQHVLNQADEKCLVLYDVDETLIVPCDKIHLPHVFKFNPGKSLKDEFEAKLGDRLEDVWGIVLLQAQRDLIEPDIVHIIKDLQMRRVMTLGLTKMRSGCFGKINSLSEYRFNQLQKLGINFQIGFAKNIEFTQFSKDWNSLPCIYNGIIMTNEISKGAVLSAFLDCLDYIPTKIIFFDDNFENVVSVNDEMQNRGIECYAYHYKMVENSAGEFDSTIAKFQLDYLAEYEIWLSEEEAQKLLL